MKADIEKVSQSESVVSKKFQQEFFQYLDNGWMPFLTQDEKSKPTIYSIDLIKKVGQGPTRLNVNFEIDVDGTPVEYDSPDAFTDNSQVEISIGKKLSEMSFTPNLESVVQSMMTFDDKATIKYFLSSSIDIANLVLDKNKAVQSKDKTHPVFGQIYSDASAQLIAEQLSSFLELRSSPACFFTGSTWSHTVPVSKVSKVSK